MAYTKKPIKRFKTTYTKKRAYSKKKNNSWALRILIYIISFFVVSWFIMILVLYAKYIKDLPEASELENLEIAESSIIYDRNWEELYKIFKEKRTYIEFEKIWENMVNAIVAGEDQDYWDNPGVDIVWIIRAWLYYIIWKTDWVKWTSTLTQQLVRNTIITNERSVERKIKEIFLAYKLTDGISKEKILELYLNKISFWHNAFWIEEAAKTFFDKSAIDLNVLESSVLASLPKWPTYYSPYNHPDRTLGFPYTYEENDEETINKIITQKDVILNQENTNKLISLISNLKWSSLEWTDKLVMCWVNSQDFKNQYNVDNDWCLVLKYSKLFDFLNDIKLSNWTTYIEYEAWRKDYILQRMLEDWYINFEEYKKSIIDSFGYVFHKNVENIKAPHFVFYVKEYLEEKYWQDIISVWGLKIYTTLDLDLQEKAEEIVEKQVEINKTKFAATNWALVSIDNKNWDILSMVGWIDYFDTENKWNVNIITSTLQPGSTFKPFVYSLWILNQEIWTKTPIYDLETEFSNWYSPSNFDWDFMGKMTISTALNNSRNIPAIKMFFMAGWESSIVSFMKRLWVNSLKATGLYWAPLALWTWEMTPLELAWAYSVFANMWEKVEINPILKVVDSKWNIIEEKLDDVETEKVMPEEQSYIINTILSDTSARPEFWNNYLSLNWRPVAAKTWTSTKQYEKYWVKDIYPRNIWTAGYTPQITTVAWSWNTDWTELNYRWNGLEWAWPIWKEYMEYAHKWKAVENWSQPSTVKNVNISEITWLLPNPESYNSDLLVNSLFINKPSYYDNSYVTVQVDALCNWIVTDQTPIAAIKNATILEFHSLIPENSKWEDPVREWSKSDEAKEKYWYIDNVITSLSNVACVRSDIESNIEVATNLNSNNTYFIWENYIEIGYKNTSTIKLIQILINWNLEKTIETNENSGYYAWNFFIPWKYKNENVEIEIRAVDEEYNSESKIERISIWWTDTTSPVIKMINPIDSSLKLYNTDYFNLKASVTDSSEIKSIIVYLNWAEYKNLWTNRNIDIPVNQSRDLTPWIYKIQIIAIDKNNNKSTEDVRLEVIQK